jgi:hypothetical protein
MKLMMKNLLSGKTRTKLFSTTATILLITFVILAVGSCKKSDSNSCQTDVASISGSYKLTSYYYRTSPSSQEVDYTNIILPDACEKDNLLVFNSNGNYQLVDAGVVCSPSSNDSGIWSLSGSTMYIDADPYNVESFDCKTLSVSLSNVNQNGDRLRLVLTKQ